MPTYHFDIADTVRLEDPVGSNCGSDADARRKADSIARQISLDLDDREVRSVIVVDEVGEELYRVEVKS